MIVEGPGIGNFDVSNDTDGLYSVEGTPNAIGRDDFLTLLVAQLRHQDPLNPLNSPEFTSQLAAFSSLEQLFNINENLSGLKYAGERSANLHAVSFLGKEVVARGNTLTLGEEKDVEGNFSLDAPAECSVRITNSNGRPIRDIDLGDLEPGEHSFRWDGRDESGVAQKPGPYFFEVTATDETGMALPLETRIIGKVTGIKLENGSPLLYIDDMPFGMTSILEVRSARDPGSQDIN